MAQQPKAWSGSFFVDTCIYDSKKYAVMIGDEVCKTLGMANDSYALVPSRLFFLDYPDYCRMVRDVYHGTLFGKAGKFIGICFKEKSDAENLCKELKRRWEYAKKFI